MSYGLSTVPRSLPEPLQNNKKFVDEPSQKWKFVSKTILLSPHFVKINTISVKVDYLV